MLSEEKSKSGHIDHWHGLNKANSIVDRLKYMHSVARIHMPFITRVAVALYDSNTDYLRTFAYSSDNESPLTNYQAKLSDCHSLLQIAKSQQPRVVQDLSIFKQSEHLHAKIIYESGYCSSYTLPMIFEGSLIGFVFFNSNQSHVFNQHTLNELDTIAHMISLLVYSEASNIKTLLATVKSALELTHSRDPETGCHIERMSRYSRIIAKHLAEKYQFNDQFIEHIFLFSPLHDLGKLVIPDRILLKEGPLDKEEKSIMYTHSKEGKRMIDKLLENYGLNGVTHVEMLRNIALHHHEAIDGSGYPDGLIGEQIPIEARIVAVADVFDALTSKRPYKDAWNNQRSIDKLKELAGKKLDAECVAALIENIQLVEEVQASFKENIYG